MDDSFDDFDGDNDHMDDGFDSGWDDEPDIEDEPAESNDDFWDGPGERDWALIFPLAEEIAKEKREQERAKREWDEDENLGYWEWLDRK